MFFDAALIDSVPRLVTPVLLAATGGALCERSGVFNISLEGMMLVGAFAAVAGTYYSGSPWGGLVVAMIAGAAFGLLFAFFSVWRNGDDIIVSIGVNILAVGLTALLLRSLFGVSGQFDDPGIFALPAINLGPVANVPLIGGLLSGQSVLVWLAVLLVFATHHFLHHHNFGLRLRAAGQNAEALRTVGLSPEWIKTGALIACGALCAVGGTQLSISNVTLFAEGMSAGRGWIALVIVMMCQGRLPWILLGALLFGFIDAVGVRLQGLDLPQQVTDALPYLLALLVLALSYRRRMGGAHAA
ncbi:MAG: ABC transporter permease [Nitratireductor sp.]|nr:ABC transporter permease [Nitratireductor sp.]